MTAEPNDGKVDGHKTNIPEQANLETARADKRLKIQRACLDTLLDCAPHAITLADRNHKLIRTNAHFTRMFGYTPEEVLGKTCDEFIVSAEKLDEASRIISTVAQGQSAKIETVRHRKDGTPVFVELTATPVLIGNMHIAERKSRSEQRNCGRNSKCSLCPATRTTPLSGTGYWKKGSLLSRNLSHGRALHGRCGGFWMSEKGLCVEKNTNTNFGDFFARPARGSSLR
jgi:PAS domain S-box-containing protein